jgi:hypothetical protein
LALTNDHTASSCCPETNYQQFISTFKPLIREKCDSVGKFSGAGFKDNRLRYSDINIILTSWTCGDNILARVNGKVREFNLMS